MHFCSYSYKWRINPPLSFSEYFIILKSIFVFTFSRTALETHNFWWRINPPFYLNFVELVKTVFIKHIDKED